MLISSSGRPIFFNPNYAYAFFNLGITLHELNRFQDAEKSYKQAINLNCNYAEAYNQDSDFYSFYRSLESYKKSFSEQGDILVLNPESEFFRYFNPAN